MSISKLREKITSIRSKIAGEPEERVYHLKCRVHVKALSFLDGQTTGIENHTENVVMLEPLESSERNRFLEAWLPDITQDERGDYKFHEVVGVVDPDGELFTPCRFAVMRRNDRLDAHHLFVMSLGPEQELKRWYARQGFFARKTVDIVVLSKEDDELSVFAKEGVVTRQKQLAPHQHVSMAEQLQNRQG